MASGALELMCVCDHVIVALECVESLSIATDHIHAHKLYSHLHSAFVVPGINSSIRVCMCVIICIVIHSSSSPSIIIIVVIIDTKFY